MCSSDLVLMEEAIGKAGRTNRMKIKIYLINILLFISFLSSNAFSKALPPGSGIGDVPANVLILLDRSGSMSARMVSGAGVYYPAATATDSNGDVFVMQAGSRGIKKFTYDTKLVDKTLRKDGPHEGYAEYIFFRD